MNPSQIRALKAKKAESLKQATALNAVTDRELTADEQTAMADHMGSIPIGQLLYPTYREGLAALAAGHRRL